MAKNCKWEYPEAIVECDWLNNRLGDQNIRIYDCTTYLHYTDNDPRKPYDVESGLKNYQKSHIPNAAYLDLQNGLSDNSSCYSFTLPNLDQLAASFKQLGVGDPHHVILYSQNGMQWATRVWWMLRAVGFDNASILNGGSMEWGRLSFPTESTVNTFDPADFKVKARSDIFVGKESVLESMEDEFSVLLNALTEDLHTGKNPRYGRRGRIPNSLNIPFHCLVEADTGKFKSPAEAAHIFSEKRINTNLEIVNYCGGGIAATLDAFVLHQLGFNKLKIYDNSMSEWAMSEDLPIETG